MVKHKKSQSTKHPEKQAIKSIGMSPATGKNKQEKRPSPSPSAVDLRQTKEPDPWKRVKWHIGKWLEGPLTLTKLVKLADDVDRDPNWVPGNLHFYRIADIDTDERVEWCTKFDTSFIWEDGKKTPLAFVDELFKFHKYKTPSVFEFMTKSLEKTNPTKGWYITRELIFQISQKLPSEFFQFELEDAKTEAALFWNLSGPDGPELRTSSLLVQFWVMAVNLMGNPWVSEYVHQQGSGRCSMLPSGEESDASISDMFAEDDDDEVATNELEVDGESRKQDGGNSDDEMAESTTSGMKRTSSQEGNLSKPFQLLSVATSPDSKRLRMVETVVGVNEIRVETVQEMSEDEESMDRMQHEDEEEVETQPASERGFS